MLKIKNYPENRPTQKPKQTRENPRKYKKAINIEDLLRWTYQDQAVDTVTRQFDAGLHPTGYRSNIISIERNGRLGTKIDCAGSAIQGCADVHPDAEAVHNAVSALRPLWIGLLIDCAKTGSRPDWMPGEEPKPEPVLRSDGKPQMEYYDPRSRRKPAYCLVQYDPEPEHLEFVRSVYTEWWDAMAALAAKLQDLGDYEVSGPNTPRQPWL